MGREGNEVSGANRARWLADLAFAIEEAQRIAWRLGVSEGDDPEAKSLYGRLMAALDEVEALQRGSWTGAQQQLDPIWMNLLSPRPPTET